MVSFRAWPCALGLVLALSLPGTAPAQGSDILLNCTACHDGADARYPVLSGQPVRYIERQLHAYREGLRQHRQMRQTAIALGDGAPAMARMFADTPAGPLEASRNLETPTLVTEGDWSRGLAPCESCHALDPEKRARLAPRLHGQQGRYLEQALIAFAEGQRQSDTLGRMRAISARLTGAEMAELAQWYADWAEAREPSEAEAGPAPSETADADSSAGEDTQ